MPFPSNSDAISRKQLADAVDAYDAEIKTLNEGKSDTYKSYREQLEATGMDGRRASAELAATKAAIARRRKLTEDPTKVREKDDLTDEILDEILPSLTRAREERPASTPPNTSKSGAEKAKTAETSTTTSAIAADPAEGAEPPSPQQASSAEPIHESSSNNDEASSTAAPQGEAVHSQGTGAETLAGREERIEGQAASADLPTHSSLQGGAEVARLAHNQEVEGAIPSPATSAEAHQEGAADGESPSPDPAEETGHHAGGENVAAPSKAGEVDATSSVIAFAPKPYDGPVDSKGLPRPHGCRDLDRCHSSTWREPCHGCKTAAQRGQVA